MRTLIFNATVIDGTGAPLRERASVLIEDHLITEVLDAYAPYYDVADQVIDARGGFLLPGVINHHVHGLTRGPLMIVGEPPLSDARVAANLDRLLAQGVTTALNVDGFATTEDAVAASKAQPITVKVATLHTPTHLSWAEHGPFPFGGVGPQHRWTVDEMLERGAPAIGEAGPGVDTHWSDYTLLPDAVASRGGRADADQGRALRRAAEAADRPGVVAALEAVGLGAADADWFDGVFERTREWHGMARQAMEEAVDAARTREAPLVLHHTPGSYDVVLEAAKALGDRVIAGHSNFQTDDPDEAAERARTLREHGAWIDIMSGDAFSAQRFHPTPAVTFRLLRDGLVDLVSTDYAGGFWDPMLYMLERAHEAGVVSLPDAVRMVTSAPAAAIPKLAPLRGRVEPGLVADLVVTEPGRLSAIRAVLVSGRIVGPATGRW